MASDALAFDTHRFVKRMTAVGMPVQQAEALAESQANLLNANLATKNELANTEATLKAEIAKLTQTLSTTRPHLEQKLPKLGQTLPTPKHT